MIFDFLKLSFYIRTLKKKKISKNRGSGEIEIIFAQILFNHANGKWKSIVTTDVDPSHRGIS